MTTAAIDAALTHLLRSRGLTKTICPSEVARLADATPDWRATMPAVHAAVAHLAAKGDILLSWRGAPRLVTDGPYRIRVADHSLSKARDD